MAFQSCSSNVQPDSVNIIKDIVEDIESKFQITAFMSHLIVLTGEQKEQPTTNKSHHTTNKISVEIEKEELEHTNKISIIIEFSIKKMQIIIEGH